MPNAETSRELSVYADGNQIGNGKRIAVRGRSNMTISPDAWVIDIYNASDSDYSTIMQCTTLSALGVDGSTLCVGKILQVDQLFEDTYLITRITVLDGDDAWRSVSNTSVLSHTGLQQALRSVLGKSSPKFRTSIGMFDNTKIARGISFFGRTVDFMQMIADKCDMILYSYRETVYLQGKYSTPDITLTDDDLLDAPQKLHGGCIVKTQVKGFFVGRNVLLRTSTVSGTFRLVAQSIDADNMDGDYNSYLILASGKAVSM